MPKHCTNVMFTFQAVARECHLNLCFNPSFFNCSGFRPFKDAPGTSSSVKIVGKVSFFDVLTSLNASFAAIVFESPGSVPGVWPACSARVTSSCKCVILFFRQRPKAFVSSSFFLVNAFSGYFRCNFFFTGSILCNKAPKVVRVRFLTQLLPSRKIVNSSRPGLLLIVITLVFLTLIFMPYSPADSCILSIISYRTG